MYRKHIYILGLLLAVSLAGCHSSKQSVDFGDDIYHSSREEQEIIHEKDSKKIKEHEGSESTYRYLSDRLGISVNSHDNIELYETAARWLHTPYKYGGNTRKGVDCSGLVCNIYKSVYHKTLQRRSIDIYQKNCSKISKRDLREGDLVFFVTGKNKGKINHVGIYLKKNKFVHASSSTGVVVSSLNDPYYRKIYYSSGRVN